MFQDTILRNIPYCDEFVILTNKRYENVVRGQLTVFRICPVQLFLKKLLQRQHLWWLFIYSNATPKKKYS